jgi:hypothetical protein
MITMLSNSLIEQLNVNRRTCHIAMKVVTADSFCYVLASACAEVYTGSVEASKAKHGQKDQMDPAGIRKNTVAALNIEPR